MPGVAVEHSHHAKICVPTQTHACPVFGLQWRDHGAPAQCFALMVIAFLVLMYWAWINMNTVDRPKVKRDRKFWE